MIHMQVVKTEQNKTQHTMCHVRPQGPLFSDPFLFLIILGALSLFKEEFSSASTQKTNF